MVKERLAEYERKSEAHKARLAQLESELNEVRTQLQEFEPQMYIGFFKKDSILYHVLVYKYKNVYFKFPGPS